jgi:hypothetical protein
MHHRVQLGTRPIDPDDIGPEIGEHHARERRRADPAELDDTDTIQRPRAHRPLHTGMRFSENARAPSWASSDWDTGRAISSCRS